ncbi:hypothetical protein TrLO_g380 [Triparma laevis f. longispina]|uniref:Uncharacterized protein n=1 Tax=Triparma laevis f. longispina TaxID=1714387 RepID=A0A9W7CNV0_9STRA|nr:hypothetical protein TrLO_g380 [Triparma laevis f. longispina]
MEDAILSSLGVTTQSASESSNRVINAALIKSAPKIISNGQLVSFFPSSTSNPSGQLPPHLLNSLLPYPNPNQYFMNLPLLRTLLSETRSNLRQTPILQSDSLRMKEQIILSLILRCNGTYANDVDLQNEEGEEKRLKNQIYKQNLRQQADLRNTEKASLQKPKKPDPITKTTTTKQIKKKRREEYVDNDKSEVDELIKKGVLTPLDVLERRSSSNSNSGSAEKVKKTSIPKKTEITTTTTKTASTRNRIRPPTPPLRRPPTPPKQRAPTPLTRRKSRSPTPPPPSSSSLTTLTCPLCSRLVPITGNPDIIMSQHMDRCSTRKKKEREVMEELEDMDVQPFGVGGDLEEEEFKELEGLEFDVESEDEEVEELTKGEVDELLDVFGENNNTTTTSSSSTTSKSSKSKSKSSPPSRSLSFRDDIDPAYYETRLNIWKSTINNDDSDLQTSLSPTSTRPGTQTLSGGLKIPAYINDRLFEYQRTGLKWMWQLWGVRAGGVVGDEMGLGKTVQVSAFLGCMGLNKKADSVLIIAPATMLQHWMTEFAKWAPGFRRILLHKSGDDEGYDKDNVVGMLRHLDRWLVKQRKQLSAEKRARNSMGEAGKIMDEFETGAGYAVVTTYESLKKGDKALLHHNWSYAVLDEGQKIRNPDTEVTLMCKSLRTVHRLLLSGTPIQNNLRELWSLFDFVHPGRLGTLPAFEVEFADPIKVGGFTNASPMQVQLAYRCAMVLKDLIGPYLLRRQKKDIKEVTRMPGKTEQVLFCRLSARQRHMYSAYLRSSEVSDVVTGRTRCFRAIGILRKLCNHPDLVCENDNDKVVHFVRYGTSELINGVQKAGKGKDDAIDVVDDDDRDIDVNLEDDEDDEDNQFSFVNRSGKLQVLAKILPLWKEQGHRVLIFSQTRMMLNLIQKFVERKGFNFKRMDGNTNVAARQGLVDKFNNDESIFGMLLTTKTGGVGVNFVGANRIILFDPDWNPQTDRQANERAWRFGQKKEVTVYRLITAGTIEEKIYHRQIFKTALSNKVLQDPRQRRLFSPGDLKDFFTLKAEQSTVADGGDGITETGDLMRGVGVVTGKEKKREKKAQAVSVAGPDGVEERAPTDTQKTLKAVLNSKGLVGVFDHDFVDTSSDKSQHFRKLEDEARTIAAEAKKSLKESVAGPAPLGQPTFTGKFGGAGSGAGAGGGSSKLLQRIQARRREIAGEGAAGRAVDLEVDQEETIGKAIKEKYATLMKRIRNYIIEKGGEVNNGGPTTKQLLDEFRDVPDSEAAVFKRMLHQLGRLEKGRWRLKDLAYDEFEEGGGGVEEGAL